MPERSHSSLLEGKRILVTNASLRTSYAAFRSLQAAGAEVFAADSYGVGMTQWSRYRKTPCLSYPSHYLDEPGFVDAVLEHVENYNIDLLLPSHNETTVLAKHRGRFPDGVCEMLPNWDKAERFNDKSKSYDLAEFLNIPTARRFFYSSITDLKHVLGQSSCNAFVIKLRTGNSAKGVFYADDVSETVHIVDELLDRFSLGNERLPQVEERIPGDGWGCSALYIDGQPVLTFCHKRMREKIRTGGTSTARLAERNGKLEEYTHRLLNAVGWHGLAMVEFKVDPDSGDVWFIEVNPRMWGSLPFAIKAGADFPLLTAIGAFSGHEAAMQAARGMSIKEGFSGRWLLGDLMVAASSARSLGLREAFRIMFSERFDCSDDFEWTDLPAFAGQFGWYLQRVLKARSFNPAEEGMLG